MQQKKETRRPFIEHWQVIKAMFYIRRYFNCGSLFHRIVAAI